MVKVFSNESPPWSVTRTKMLCELAVSKSSNVPSATVITPVSASMAKRPPASSTSEYVSTVPASGSVVWMVPTTVPFVEFSTTPLLLRVCAGGRLVRVIQMDREVLVDESPALVGYANRNAVDVRRFEVEPRTVDNRDHARVRIDCEAAVGVVRQGEHRAGVRIDALDRADNRTVRRILVNCSADQNLVGRRLVHIGHRNGEALVEERPP